MGRHPRPRPDPAQPRQPEGRGRRRGARSSSRHRPRDPAGGVRGPHLLRRRRPAAVRRPVAAPPGRRPGLGEDQARPPQPDGRARHGRHPGAGPAVLPRLVGRWRRLLLRLPGGGGGRGRDLDPAAPSRRSLARAAGRACPWHDRPVRSHVRDGHRGVPDLLARDVRRARDAAPAEPAEEGPDPVLVRPRRDGRRPRPPRDRGPGRRRRRAVGVPRDRPRPQRGLPAPRHVLRSRRRDHPGRAGRCRGDRRHHGRRQVGSPQHDRDPHELGAGAVGVHDGRRRDPGRPHRRPRPRGASTAAPST